MAAALAEGAVHADATDASGPLETYFEVSDGDVLGPPVDDELLLQDLWEELNQQGWDPALYDLKSSDATAEATPPPASAGGSCSSTSPFALEDAPEGSSAHLKVRFYSSQRRWTFRIPGAEENKFFQVTTRASKISEEDAGRIARLCFVRFEEGAEKSEVEAYKHNLMKMCVGRGKAPAPAPEVGAAGRAKAESPEASAKRRRLDEAARKARGNRQGPASAAPPAPSAGGGTGASVLPKEEEAPASGPEDAPEGSDAFSNVKVKNTGSGGKVCYFENVGKHGVRVQTTQNAAGGALEEAARICRLCYLKAKSGATKDEVVAYRQELYRKCQQPGARAPLHEEHRPSSCADPGLPVSSDRSSPLPPPQEEASSGQQVEVARHQVTRPLDAVPMTPAGHPPGHGSSGPPVPVTPSESLGLDALVDGSGSASGAAGGQDGQGESAPAAGGQQWRADSWGSEAWPGGPGEGAAWATAAWRGASEIGPWFGRGPPPPPPPPPPATAGALPTTPTVPPQEGAQAHQPRSPSSGTAAAVNSVEKAQMELSGELRGLAEKLWNTNCVPAAAVSILEDYMPRFGVASAFAALADAFNACAEGGDGDEEQQEAFRQVLMYLCHEILDLSMLYPHNQTGVFEHARCDFFDSIRDEVCKAPVRERMAYERLIGIWEQRQFFQGSVIEGLRVAWNLESSPH